MRKKSLIILLLCLLALPVTLLACGGQTEEVETMPPVGLVVTPSTAAVGATVSILGSGLNADDEIDLRIRLDGSDPIGITGLLTALPVVQESGAFVASLKLTNFSAGIYTVQLVVNDKLAATAPLQVT